MITLLHAMMESSIVLACFQATAIMGLAVSLGTVFRDWAAIRCCIYSTALACSLGAPVLLFASSFLEFKAEFALPIGRFQDDIQTIEILRHALPVEQEDFRFANKTEIVSVLDDAMAGTANKSPQSVGVPRPSFQSLLLGLWFCGSFLQGLGIIISMIRLRRLLKKVEILDENLADSASRRAATNLGIAEFPRIGISASIRTPLAVSFPGSSWVLLPKTCIGTMAEDQLVHVLTHEAAHIARRDPLILLLQRIHLLIWWWNPLAHSLNRRFNQAREEVCDNAVLAQAKGGAYGMTLLTLGKLITSDRYSVGTVGLFGSRWSLEHRIKGLLNPRRKTMIHVNKAVSVPILILFVVVTALTSITRIEATESQNRKENERRKTRQQIEALSTAERHLRLAGMQELAREVRQQARGLEKTLQPTEENRGSRSSREHDLRVDHGETHPDHDHRIEPLEDIDLGRNVKRESEIRVRLDDNFRGDVIRELRDLGAALRKLRLELALIEGTASEEKVTRIKKSYGFRVHPESKSFRRDVHSVLDRVNSAVRNLYMDIHPRGRTLEERRTYNLELHDVFQFVVRPEDEPYRNEVRDSLQRAYASLRSFEGDIANLK